MIEKIEYGLPQLYLFEVDENGDNPSETVAISSFDEDTRVVTLGTPVTVASVGKMVVFHQDLENNYGFGTLISTTEIELAEDSKQYFIAPAVNITVYRGMGIASYADAEMSADQTGINYKGQYAYDREVFYTDVDGTFTINSAVFTNEFVEFINGYESSDFGGGSATLMSDFNVKTDKEVRPKDVTVVALKRRIQDDDKWEEFYFPRVKTGDFELANMRDDFTTPSFSFNLHTKSISNGDVMGYRIEE